MTPEHIAEAVLLANTVAAQPPTWRVAAMMGHTLNLHSVREAVSEEWGPYLLVATSHLEEDGKTRTRGELLVGQVVLMRQLRDLIAAGHLPLVTDANPTPDLGNVVVSITLEGRSYVFI